MRPPIKFDRNTHKYESLSNQRAMKKSGVSRTTALLSGVIVVLLIFVAILATNPMGTGTQQTIVTTVQREVTRTVTMQVTATAPPGLGATTVKIGILAPLTGPFAAWGTQYLEAARLAVEEINAAGGVHGARVELVVADDRNDAREAVAAFQKLVDVDKVVAVAGLINSALISAVKPYAEQYKIPLIINLGGSVAFSDLNMRYLFRGCNPNADILVKATADFIRERGYKRVSVFIASYEWGFSVRDAAVKYIGSLPGVTLTVEESQLGATELTPHLRRIQANNPEVIITYGNPPAGIALTKQGLEQGIRALYIGGFYPIEQYVSTLGEQIYNNVVDLSCVDRNSREYVSVATKFYQRTNKYMEDSGVWGYITVYRIVDAVKHTRSVDPSVIADDIRSRKYRNPMLVFPMSYTENGEWSEPRLAVLQFERGDPGPVNPRATWVLKQIYITKQLTPFIPEK